MSPLRRSPPDPARPTLRQRMAALKAGIARSTVQPAAPAPEPLPLPELGVEGAPPASHADAALIRLGREFEAAQARAAILWRDWNDRADAAGAAHPIRPAILTFRAEDAAFCLRKLHRTPDAIDGTAVMADDIAWMRRRPLTHQVVRDARPGEHGWRDFGGRVPEIVPWPEAQARADELITAWDGWRADVQRVRDEHGVDAAEDRNDEAEAVVLSLCDRIAALPATTAEGLRIKLRASAHYEEDHDSAYPGGRLLNSLLADATREGLPADRDIPSARETTTILGFGPDSAIAELATEFCRAFRFNILADRDIAAGKITHAEWQPYYDAVCILMDQLEQAVPATMLGMALKCLAPIGAAAWNVGEDADPTKLDRWERVGAQFEALLLKGGLVSLPAPGPGGSSLFDRDLCKEAFHYAWSLDLSPVPTDNLQRLYDLFSQTSDTLSDATCEKQFWAPPGSGCPTAGHVPLEAESNRLACLRDACAQELRRRTPEDDRERDALLTLRLRHELLCEGKVFDQGLLAEVNAAWSR